MPVRALLPTAMIAKLGRNPRPAALYSGIGRPRETNFRIAARKFSIGLVNALRRPAAMFHL